jgi:hypothetical protein
MRLALVGIAAAVAWLLWRGRRDDVPRVVVGWKDGSEVALAAGTPQHERLVSLAGRALG